MFFLSSSIIPSSQVHVLFLPFSSRSAAKILSFLFLFYLVLTGVVSESILFLELLILVIILVPLFYQGALDFVHLLSCVLTSPLPLYLPSRS